MQTEQQTQERQIVNLRRGRFDTEKSSGARTPTEILIQRRKQQRWRRHQQTAEKREHHSMNVEC